MSQARCTFQIPGLDCPAEVEILNAGLIGACGVLSLGFDLIHGTMTVDYDPSDTDPEELMNLISKRSGMSASMIGTSLSTLDTWHWARSRQWYGTILSGVTLFLAVGISWSRGPAWLAPMFYACSILAGGIELFPKALSAARRLHFDIHVLMGLAVLGAILLGQWDEAATVSFLFGLSEALEALSLNRARSAVRSLLEVTPERAEVVEIDGSTRRIDAELVHEGDRIRVRDGDRIPVDGVVLTGRSSVDQKAITGESVSILREPGDTVFAGSINGDGLLEIEAAGPLRDSLISRVLTQVREAQAAKTIVERRLARFASVYTPLVMGVAFCMMIGPPLYRMGVGEPAEWVSSFSRGLVVLVIACPCALVIATPVAVVSALASAARKGVLVKGGQFLEEIGRLRVLAFDKTGTLTRGEPLVVEIVSVEGRMENDLLRIAAALGDRGGHVLGRAIARHAREQRIDVPKAESYTAYPGLGARGEVGDVQYHIGSHRYLDESGLCPPEFHSRLGRAENAVGTSVALSTQAGPLGWIRLADHPRPEAAGVLSELGRMGVHTVMLTGDNTKTAAAMAKQLGMTEHRSNLLPTDKVNAVAELEAARGATGMVGDGVNDAPALAAARVSVAVGGAASGAVLESADIVLMADDLSALPWIIRHSRRTLSLIRQNIILALATKAIVLGLAVLGLANLWLAIGADVGTSLLVVLNALRLLRVGPN
jgi:Cd2+/Zn2+-exporting ATPase